MLLLILSKDIYVKILTAFFYIFSKIGVLLGKEEYLFSKKKVIPRVPKN